MKKGIFHIIFCMLLVLPATAWAQPTNGQNPQEGKKNYLRIDKADILIFGEYEGEKIRKLIGNVELTQDTTKMYCDSAYQYLDSNFVIAFGDVRIVLSAGLGREVFADKLTYDGNEKIVDLYDNVLLRDSSVTLTTNRLTYYRQEDYGKYFTGGRIINGDNTLYSRTGYYYPKEEMTYFRKDVLLVNPDFLLQTDTLGYQTKTEIAYFLAPTYVYDSLNSMYTEDGYYDTVDDIVYLYQNPQVGDTSYTLYADTITYNENEDLGLAYGNVAVVEADTGLTLYGQYGEFHSRTEESTLTQQSFGIQIMDDDTLFLFADTLRSVKDSIRDERVFYAYYNALFFMEDLQGIADSITYFLDDSLMYFDDDPVMWSDSTQITGESMMVGFRDSKIDTMSIPKEAWIINQADSVGFNQIKGQAIRGKFKENKMDKMWVQDNAESIYFTKDDQKGKYIGMSNTKCINMYIEFADNEPERIFFLEKPSGTLFPMYEIFNKPNRLDGFRWREEERPIRPEWLFAMIHPEEDTVLLQVDAVLDELKRYQYVLDSSLGFEGSSPEAPGGADKVAEYLDSLKNNPFVDPFEEDDDDFDSTQVDPVVIDSIPVQDSLDIALDSLNLDTLALDSAEIDSILGSRGRGRSNTGKTTKPKKPRKPKKQKTPKAPGEKFTLRKLFQKISDGLGLQGRKPAPEREAERKQKELERQRKKARKVAEKQRKEMEKQKANGEEPEKGGRAR